MCYPPAVKPNILFTDIDDPNFLNAAPSLCAATFFVFLTVILSVFQPWYWVQPLFPLHLHLFFSSLRSLWVVLYHQDAMWSENWGVPYTGLEVI